MTKKVPTSGEVIRVVAKSEVDGMERLTKLSGKVSHVNDSKNELSVWFEVESRKYWWADEPRDLAREGNTSVYRDTDLIGVSPSSESNNYQVRIDSNDGFCNPIGELVEFGAGQVIA